MDNASKNEKFGRYVDGLLSDDVETRRHTEELLIDLGFTDELIGCIEGNKEKLIDLGFTDELIGCIEGNKEKFRGDFNYILESLLRAGMSLDNVKKIEIFGSTPNVNNNKINHIMEEHIYKKLSSTSNENYINKFLDEYLKGFESFGQNILEILIGFERGREYIVNNKDKFKGVNYNNAVIESMNKRNEKYKQLGLGAGIDFPTRRSKNSSPEESIVHIVGIIGDEIELGGDFIEINKDFLIRWINALPNPNKNVYEIYAKLIHENVKDYISNNEVVEILKKKAKKNKTDTDFAEYIERHEW